MRSTPPPWLSVSSAFAKATSRACDLQRMNTYFGSPESERILVPALFLLAIHFRCGPSQPVIQDVSETKSSQSCPARRTHKTWLKFQFTDEPVQSVHVDT